MRVEVADAPRVPAVQWPTVERRTVEVGGTHLSYLVAGDGPAVVLVHGGEPGASGELAWEYNVGVLASRFRVYVPDLPGFGASDKLFSFDDHWGFVTGKLSAFCENLGIEEAPLVGTSMSAALLVRDAASKSPQLSPSVLVLIAGGGAIPASDARESLTKFDGSRAGMVAVLKAMFHAPIWWEDEQYVSRRMDAVQRPGVWECIAAARLVSPYRAASSPYGAPDRTEYEEVSVPTLILSGRHDRLKERGYGRELAGRIPQSAWVEVADAGHCPHIEKPDEVNQILVRFLERGSLD